VVFSKALPIGVTKEGFNFYRGGTKAAFCGHSKGQESKHHQTGGGKVAMKNINGNQREVAAPEKISGDSGGRIKIMP